MNEIIKMLGELSSDTYTPENPSVSLSISRLPANGAQIFSNDQVDLLEKKYQTKLPEEYRKLITEFGVFSLEYEFGEESDSIMLLEFEGLYKDLYSPITGTKNAELTRVFPFAVDFGGHQYFYDLDNQTGLGQFSVLTVYPGNLKWNDCFYRGKSLTEILHRQLNGIEFTEGRYLQK